MARPKPAPDVFLHAAKAMGVKPARCVVVEDSVFGVRAARAAGMRTFGYFGGLTRVERLTAEGAWPLAEMCELPGLINAARLGDTHGRGSRS